MKRWIIAIVCLALLLAGIFGAVLHFGTVNRMVTCRANLVHIAQALQAYAQTAGVYPSNWAQLHLAERDFPYGPICPESRQPYVLLVGGLRPDQVQPASIMVMDPAGSHSGEGWVLYGDGQIAMMPAKRIEAVLKLMQYRPPMMPMTPATTAPSAY